MTLRDLICPTACTRTILSVGVVSFCWALASCAPVPSPAPESDAPASSTPQFTPAEHDSEALLPPIDATSASGTLLPSGVLSFGNPDASAVLLVFTNHACRYCREFHNHHLQRLLEGPVRDGTLRIDIAMRPLRTYPQSSLGAAALLCAGSHASAMHDALVALPDINRTTILDLVEEEGWGTDAFVACFDGGGATERMDALASLAASLDVQSVPTSFLNGERIVGLLEYAELQGMVRDATTR